jgi:hypothetical protein
MRSALGLSIVWIALAFSLAHAAPARPLYQPTSPPAPPVRKFVNLNNTAWLGKYNAVARTFIFEPDGTLSYRSPTSKAAKGFKNRGFWKLEGNNLFFEHYINPNSKLMEFRGTVIDGNTIVGEATYLLLRTKAPQTMQRAATPK